ncbi:MAG: NUDIX hydrolase [Caldilineaceae bacterium]
MEYAEAPEDAARREADEETGLQVEVDRCLGWYFSKRTDYPGPMLSFMFETHAIGGQLIGSSEGRTGVYPIEHFPVISPSRTGSVRTLQAYLSFLSDRMSMVVHER